MTDAIAPTAPASRKLRIGPSCQCTLAAPATAAPMRDERDLTEADLARPPGEDHERDRDDGVDDHRGGQVGVALARAERQGEEDDDEQRRRSAAERPLHLGQAPARAGWAARSPRSASSRWPGPRRGDSRLRRCRSSATITITNMTGSTSAAEPLFQMIDVSTMPRPHDGHEDDGEVLHPPDHRGGEGAEQDRGPNAEPSGRPMMPARRIRAIVASRVAMIHATLWVKTDVDAEQRGPIGALAAGPHGDADARVAEEREQPPVDRAASRPPRSGRWRGR